jgi:pimeloyl-ACP methyl ester carboxylesterase
MPLRGTVVLLHGFARRPRALDDLADRCSALDADVVRPHLSAWWWPTCTNNTRHLDRIAMRVRAERDDGPVVVVGHSAGAAAGAWIAARLVDAHVHVGALVLVDGVESPVRSISRAWPRLAGVPVTAVVGPPGPCNRQQALGRWFMSSDASAGPVVDVVELPAMGHGDIEGVGVGVYVRLCGDDPAAPSREVLMALVLDAVERGLQAGANESQS